jgi:uncharacterized protein YggE
MRSYSITFALLTSIQSISSIAQPVIQAVPERPRIVVDGHGEFKSMPDVATVNYTIRGEGATSDDAVRAMTAQGARIEAGLRGLDSLADPRTAEVKVTPVRSDDCKESDSQSLQLSTGPCAILGYVATQSIILRTTAVSAAGTMVGIVGRGGGFDARINSFDLQDPRAAERQATAAALSDAAAKASAIAEATRAQLGPILSISTTARDNEQLITVTAERRPAPLMAIAPPPVPVTAKPEPITTSANVMVTYAIGK